MPVAILGFVYLLCRKKYMSVYRMLDSHSFHLVNLPCIKDVEK